MGEIDGQVNRISSIIIWMLKSDYKIEITKLISIDLCSLL